MLYTLLETPLTALNLGRTNKGTSRRLHSDTCTQHMHYIAEQKQEPAGLSSTFLLPVAAHQDRKQKVEEGASEQDGVDRGKTMVSIQRLDG